MANATIVSFSDIVDTKTFAKILREHLDSERVFRLRLDLGNNVGVEFLVSNRATFINVDYNTPLARTVDANGVAKEFVIAAVRNYVARNRRYLSDAYFGLQSVTPTES